MNKLLVAGIAIGVALIAYWFLFCRVTIQWKDNEVFVDEFAISTGDFPLRDVFSDSELASIVRGATTWMLTINKTRQSAARASPTSFGEIQEGMMTVTALTERAAGKLAKVYDALTKAIVKKGTEGKLPSISVGV